jgi:hypothetical protein
MSKHLTAAEASSKRTKVEKILYVAESIRIENPTPATKAMLITGVAALFIMGPLLRFGIAQTVLAAPAFAVMVYILAPFPKSWPVLLDKLLADYEPVFPKAYADLQAAIRTAGGLDLSAIAAWAEIERGAIDQISAPQVDGDCPRFTSKHISDSENK